MPYSQASDVGKNDGTTGDSKCPICIGDFCRDRAIVTVPDEDVRIECEERGNMTSIFFTMQDGERFGVKLRGNMRNGRMIGTLPNGNRFEAEIRNGKLVGGS